MSTEGNEVSVFIHLPNVSAAGLMNENGCLAKPLLFINGKIAPMTVERDLLGEANRCDKGKNE